MHTKHTISVDDNDSVVTSQKPGLALLVYAGMEIWVWGTRGDTQPVWLWLSDRTFLGLSLVGQMKPVNAHKDFQLIGLS